jgi:hypothetical protein
MPVAETNTRARAMNFFIRFCLALLMAWHASSWAQAPASPVQASLTLSKKGFLDIALENKATVPVTLLDVREGDAACAWVWRVEIQTEDGQQLAPAMWYSPAGFPHEVSIDPGKTYHRLIQLGAYVEPPKTQGGRIRVVVHYEVGAPLKNWGTKASRDLRFSSQPLELNFTDIF